MLVSRVDNGENASIGKNLSGIKSVSLPEGLEQEYFILIRLLFFCRLNEIPK